MSIKTLVIIGAAWFASLVCAAVTFAQEPALLQLPKPHASGGRPLMEVLKDRSSSRTFSSEKLSSQQLSDLLWAAFGVNRPESGKRTAPSAMNWQQIDIYVALAEGLYLFEAQTHSLKLILEKDIRAATGEQPFVHEAPVNLIYVADYSRMDTASDADKAFYSAANTGFIGQNVYLYCASEGLSTVVRGTINRRALAEQMGLLPEQKIILAQSVGYPKQ